MDERIFDFQDDTRLNELSATAGELTAIVGTDGFSVLVTDPSSQVALLRKWVFPTVGASFSEVEMSIRQIFGSEAVFARTFARAHCALSNSNVTLMPRRLFRPDDLAGYFSLLLPPAEYVYGYEELPEFECFLVYAAEPVAEQLCAHYFSRAPRRHLAAPLLKAWRRQAPLDDAGVMVNLGHQRAQVAVFERRNLLLYNSYTFRHAHDLLYFVLLAYDQFRLRPADVPLTLSGALLPDSDAYRLLSRYIGELRFANPPGALRLPAAAQTLPAHCHFDLFSVYGN
jgi:hypothetical protein